MDGIQLVVSTGIRVCSTVFATYWSSRLGQVTSSLHFLTHANRINNNIGVPENKMKEYIHSFI